MASGRRIAFMNQKGGVGKTTCVVNLGAAVARAGRKVLIVDTDPQANLGLHLGIDTHSLERSIYDVLQGSSTVADAVIPEIRPNLSVLPANLDLSGAEIEMVNVVGRESLLRDALRPYIDGCPHEFVFIDCPPSLGILSLNAMTAAREVFIPLQTEYFALQGMAKLLDVVRLIRQRLNPELEVTGVIPTMYDTRTNLSKEVVEEIRAYFGDKVFRQVIRKNVRLAEAPSHGKTIFDYDAGSMGASDFGALAEEILL